MKRYPFVNITIHTNARISQGCVCMSTESDFCLRLDRAWCTGFFQPILRLRSFVLNRTKASSGRGFRLVHPCFPYPWHTVGAQ